MRFAWLKPAMARRTVVLGLALVALALLLSSGVSAQTQTPPQQPAQQAAQTQAPAKPGLAFQNDAGLVLLYVKQEKTADFEALMTKLKDALAKNESPEVKQQAAGWKIFKAPNGPAPQGAVAYIMMMDPVVKGAEYSFLGILYKAFPSDAKAIFDQWNDLKAANQPVVTFDLALVTKMQ